MRVIHGSCSVSQAPTSAPLHEFCLAPTSPSRPLPHTNSFTPLWSHLPGCATPVRLCRICLLPLLPLLPAKVLSFAADASAAPFPRFLPLCCFLAVQWQLRLSHSSTTGGTCRTAQHREQLPAHRAEQSEHCRTVGEGQSTEQSSTPLCRLSLRCLTLDYSCHPIVGWVNCVSSHTNKHS